MRPAGMSEGESAVVYSELVAEVKAEFADNGDPAIVMPEIAKRWAELCGQPYVPQPAAPSPAAAIASVPDDDEPPRTDGDLPGMPTAE